MIKPLEEVLAYKNKFVIDRFKKFRPDAADEAEQIFDDLKRFLWLVATLQEQKAKGAEVPDVSFPVSMIIMDDMWHAFILWTNFYTDFCDKYFGQYLHHPTEMPIFEKNHIKGDMPEEEANDIFLRGMITVVIDVFGETLAQRWFDEYSKYPRAGIH